MAVMRKSSIVSFFVYLISLLPFWVLYAFSNVLYLLLYYVIGYRKAVVYENLRNAFPEKTDSERRQIARKFYRFLPDLIVEAVKMRSISAEAVEKRIVIHQKEELERHFRAGKGVIGVTAHYANWELGIHRLSLLTENPVLIIYKPLHNQTVDLIYNAIRGRFGATMVPMKQTLRKIIAHRQQPHISIFVADQTPMYKDSNYFIPFLNQDTLVYTGAEKIAKMTNFPVVFCHIDRIRRGHYSCTFTTLVENPAEVPGHGITDIHNKFTEDIIRRKPEWWLWSHRRWKRKPKP
ncbi:lysophospholipid acyltransferase family protein [Parapedobacter sp. ISTM3]|uniref:lysophospholipid acyltransferase family protein n=1 Tax=Parapedobacter sp. ISTM3 TaxID=2800130 RepID=UPI001904FB44|nr:lysophospholipid acyltransferase family protein [Parapedobacter sp. ISTM3]MBK1439228.1 lysophospholipid acyltransferase family protein [Parapedobacter sp. ISTM3]